MMRANLRYLWGSAVPIDVKSAAIGATAAAVVVGGLMFGLSGRTQPTALYGPPAGGPASAPAATARGAQEVTLNQGQMQHVKVAPVEERDFANRREAIGNVDFNEERSVQVFPTNQGRIRRAFARIGEDVRKGQPLFEIDSPDLVQAESTLISTAGTRELTTRALQRARGLLEIQGNAQKDVDQAVADQQTADAAYKAARNAVAIFGKSEAEMDRMIKERRTDPVLTVTSPIDGRVTARNAQPGLLVQPGSSTAPYTVSDLSTMWMQAFVPETDSPLLRVGQPVKVKVMAFPGRVFDGKVTSIGATVDAGTHRVLVRSEIQDPHHELRPGMFTSFEIRTGEPIRSPALTVDGVVREGDGTMTAWVTADRKRFTRRVVKIGLMQDDVIQIVDGLRPGELAATEGALFISNAAAMSGT